MTLDTINIVILLSLIVIFVILLNTPWFHDYEQHEITVYELVEQPSSITTTFNVKRG